MKRLHLSTYIALTISLLVISSILIISGVLYFNLSKSLTSEFEDRIKAQCGEAAQILSGRLHSTQDRLKTLSLDSTIKITLMLKVYQELKDYLSNEYGSVKHTYFFIKPSKSKHIFTSFKNNFVKKAAEKFFISSDNSGTLIKIEKYGFAYLFSSPVLQHKYKIGTAWALYMLKDDKTLLRTICKDKECSIIKLENGNAWNLFTGEVIKGFKIFKGAIKNFGLSYIELNNEKIAAIKSKKLPNLIYISRLNKLHDAKMKVLKPLLYSSVFVFMLTVIISFFLSRFFSRPLLRISQTALQIAEGKKYNDRKKIFSKVIEIEQIISSLSIMVENLKKAEELKRYRQLFEGVADPVFIYDFSGRILDVNKIAMDQFGLSKQKFSHRTIIDTIPDKHHKNISDLIQELFKTGSPIVFETEMFSKNNTIIYIECHAKKIIFKGQDAVLSVARDITERRKAQQDLVKSEERLSLALDISLAITWELDLKTKEFTIDTGRFKFPGYGKKDIKTIKDTLKLIHPENIHKSMYRFNKLLKGKIPYYYDDFSIVTENGELRWFHNRAKIIKFDDAKKPWIIIGTAIDISELKQAEQTLRDNEERYRTILENRNIGYFEVDLKGNMTFFNDAMCDLSGYSHDELLGMNYKAYTDDKTSERIKRIYNAILKTGRPIKNFEYSAHRKSGTLVEIEASVSLIKDLNGRPCGFRGLVIDITDRKTAEKEREKLEAELRQFHKMEAIGTLAGGIAHDFNNILSGIFGYCQLAEMNIENPVKTKACIAQVFKAGQRAAGLIQQILTFTRQTEHEKHLLNISIVVEEALKLLRSSIPSTIEIQENIVSEKYVMADPTQIHQVVMNLCTNAYHAMRINGGTLTIELDDMKIPSMHSFTDINIPPGKYVLLKISDTGHGIEKNILGKIFDPYFSTKEAGDGTGLGLALVYAIVEDHKGYIKADSIVGKGSEFYVFLPAARKESDLKKHEIHKKSLKGGKETIMLVDDEISILESTKEFLTDYGYNVKFFLNGAEAFEEFRKMPHAFDLIITDMTMPRMTGDKLSIEILKIRKNIPIILCTGYNENISEDRALEIGIKKYIQKPMDSRALIELIRELLDNNKTLHDSQVLFT